MNALANDIVADNMAQMTVATVAGVGLAAAIGAAVLTGFLVGASAAASAAVVTAMGSYALATSAYLGITASMAAATASFVGAAAAATVVGTVLFAVVVTAISIWMLVENESIGKTLQGRVSQALAASDPLGLKPLIPLYAGKPLRSAFDPKNPPSYRTPEAIGKLHYQGRAVDERGRRRSGGRGPAGAVE